MLLSEVAKGNENAFTLLFKNYHNLLAAFIIRITESEQLTQEIVQDVFLKIWINRGSLAELNCFKAYLFVVARNHTFNCLKQIAREKNRKKEWINTVLHQVTNSAEEPAAIDTGKLMDDAIELLPLQQKKVYILSRRDGIRQQEIARELNISHETVKKHMVLALRFLKNHLRTHIGIFTLFITSLFKG